jgi:hypothetical protein
MWCKFGHVSPSTLRKPNCGTPPFGGIGSGKVLQGVPRQSGNTPPKAPKAGPSIGLYGDPGVGAGGHFFMSEVPLQLAGCAMPVLRLL